MPDDMESFGRDFLLTLLTTDPAAAVEGEKAGIQRIGIDIERLGKAARQAGHDTRVSDHTWDDLSQIASVLRTSDVFVRLNPPHSGTVGEIDVAIERGATVLMLPYFQSEADAAVFADHVGGRAHTMLLVETPRSIVRIQEIAETAGIDEIMIGLNDLRLTMNLEGFEFVCSPLMTTIARIVQDCGKRFSFGGLGRHDDTTLPVNPDLLYAQYPRLGATGAWLSRSFFQNPPVNWTVKDGVESLRARLSFWAGQSEHDLVRAKQRLASQSIGSKT
ncbi:aldolase/citrate lyase family protein [Rhodoplanes sp. Z2-YC6860]|uniref:aldolase/citrate lyase family protein n=1 Tax=Rhodoplanes sp. Z2-YC6860 TaxID=674703 RepID=UPI00078EF2CA|nr:aldolase/citrate lyase family protein [Rhodoplanes sp. Z2-YC6860]AMN38985.1 HpcH/HpaI aldolase [Rhodoplanes sp. Z2-YC6860]